MARHSEIMRQRAACGVDAFSLRGARRAVKTKRKQRAEHQLFWRGTHPKKGPVQVQLDVDAERGEKVELWKDDAGQPKCSSLAHFRAFALLGFLERSRLHPRSGPHRLFADLSAK